MTNMDEREKSEEYFKDHKEWQDSMYSPGKYLGGNLPPILKHGNRKVIKPWAVISLIILGTLIGLAILNMVVYFINGKGLFYF